MLYTLFPMDMKWLKISMEHVPWINVSVDDMTQLFKYVLVFIILYIHEEISPSVYYILPY